MTYLKTLVAAFMLTVTLPALAGADTLLWTIGSNYDRTISLEFYSQDRNHVWPGNDQVYVMDAYQGRSTFNLSCNYDELICYGAWERNNSSTYWGVGPNDGYNCENCCARCGRGNVEAFDLVR
ncbi:hypothetical protein [Pseudoruegeria sp. HB172150]|uniref:hypothetical protein n=1 Tax=Pseudoruegeria sp. HB172150 TaxID=2721164 RepID=UPI001557537B|nr:hypothetical protein [Pseudoruegeria sp. HB172150]